MGRKGYRVLTGALLRTLTQFKGIRELAWRKEFLSWGLEDKWEKLGKEGDREVCSFRVKE